MSTPTEVAVPTRRPVWSLTGRVALVTGAGRGVGAGIAEVLAERGAAVAVNDLHADRAAAVVGAIEAAGGTATAVVFDVCDDDAVREGVAGIADWAGAVDLLVNNAGIPEDRRVGLFVDSSAADWLPFLQLNVWAPMYCLRATLPEMVRRGFGRVVQISSGAGARGLPDGSGEALYGGSKAFMDGLLRHVANEVARHGVTVNAIAPGLITSALAYADPDLVHGLLERIPMGRLGEPREIGDAVAWLASDGAAFVTGQVIHVNGGSYQGR